jgi:uncharacterized membrane protein
MEFMDMLTEFFRWTHIVVGIIWIGISYFFTFVFLRFAPTMDEGVRKQVMTGMLPRGVYLMRWSAFWTWVLGLLLMMMVFYHGGLMFEPGGGAEWSITSVLMLLVVYVGGFAVYEGLARSPLSKNSTVFGVVSFVIIAVAVYLMKEVAGFSYRAYVIHTGAMFGTIMTANVWMNIWPAQRRIIHAIKNGEAPDMSLFGRVAKRAEHNTYLSVPLLYMMINLHTSVTGAATSVTYLLAAILIGWLGVKFLYTQSAKPR